MTAPPGRSAPAEQLADPALVARIIGGDRDALAQLYRRHGPWLLARLESRCGDADLADLALQDTFVAVWRGGRGYRGDGEVAAWLWGIAVRRLIDHLRKRRPVPIGSAALHARDTPAAAADVVALGGGLDARLQSAMAALGPELRAVLVVTALDGLSTAEAAVLLGIPRGTVKTRLMRARTQLREALS